MKRFFIIETALTAKPSDIEFLLIEYLHASHSAELLNTNLSLTNSTVIKLVQEFPSYELSLQYYSAAEQSLDKKNAYYVIEYDTETSKLTLTLLSKINSLKKTCTFADDHHSHSNTYQFISPSQPLSETNTVPTKVKKDSDNSRELSEKEIDNALYEEILESYNKALINADFAVEFIKQLTDNYDYTTLPKKIRYIDIFTHYLAQQPAPTFHEKLFKGEYLDKTIDLLFNLALSDEFNAILLLSDATLRKLLNPKQIITIINYHLIIDQVCNNQTGNEVVSSFMNSSFIKSLEKMNKNNIFTLLHNYIEENSEAVDTLINSASFEEFIKEFCMESIDKKQQALTFLISLKKRHNSCGENAHINKINELSSLVENVVPTAPAKRPMRLGAAAKRGNLKEATLAFNKPLNRRREYIIDKLARLHNEAKTHHSDVNPSSDSQNIHIPKLKM